MPSQVPVRYPSGVTSDFPWGPLANCGAGNPFFYHMVADDMDQEISESGYTKTTTGNGTVALTPGDGGLALFTTNSSTPTTTDVAAIQLPAADFTFTAGKKSFFLCRVNMADTLNAALNVGLIQTTTTPFTVTDGIYFNKASGVQTLNLNIVATSVVTTVAIPAAYLTMTNGVSFDVGWYVDRNVNVFAFVGSQLVGWIPQSGTGAQTPPQAGAVASYQQANGALTLTTANLNPTIALQSGTASSKTMTLDFYMSAKER